DVVFFDARKAYGENVWLRRLMWHFADHRPARLLTFSKSVEAAARRAAPLYLISTGLAPLTVRTLSRLKAQGIRCLHYSTDDPWNPGQRAEWFLQGLPLYDHIFSTRRSNLADFRKQGCASVSYLPFAFDPELFFLESRSGCA